MATRKTNGWSCFCLFVCLFFVLFCFMFLFVCLFSVFIAFFLKRGSYIISGDNMYSICAHSVLYIKIYFLINVKLLQEHQLRYLQKMKTYGLHTLFLKHRIKNTNRGPSKCHKGGVWLYFIVFGQFPVVSDFNPIKIQHSISVINKSWHSIVPLYIKVCGNFGRRFWLVWLSQRKIEYRAKT